MRIIFATRVMGGKALLVRQLDPTTGKVTDFEETGQMLLYGKNKNKNPCKNGNDPYRRTNTSQTIGA